jgi:hypothetical protein
LRPLLAASYTGGAGAGGTRLHAQARKLQEDALAQAMRERQLANLVAPRHLAHQVLSAYNQAGLHWALGEFGPRAFETQVLHAWCCMLLGLARGPARARVLAELEALEGQMARGLGGPSAAAAAARGGSRTA